MLDTTDSQEALAIINTMWAQIGSDAEYAVSARQILIDTDALAVTFQYGKTPNPTRRAITVKYERGLDLYTVQAHHMNRKTSTRITDELITHLYADQLSAVIRRINNERG